jgi:hypothetical protein
MTDKIVNILRIIRGKKKGAEERFLKLMMNLSIIKLAATMVTLMVMMVLFFTHLHVLAPITAQFSKWVSSPLVGFIIFIMVVKIVGVSIGLGLTILTVKKITIEDIRLRVKKSCKLRLPVFLWKKVQPTNLAFNMSGFTFK